MRQALRLVECLPNPNAMQGARWKLSGVNAGFRKAPLCGVVAVKAEDRLLEVRCVVSRFPAW